MDVQAPPSTSRPPSPQQRRAARRSLGLTVALLALLYLGLRLPALLALPLFNDEAVYLVRARFFPAMLATPGVASATLPEGKLLHELALAALAPLPVDPLIPARLLSVACGLATTLTLVATGRSLGHPRAGALAGALYALAPLAGLHDVLGLPDSMLALASALLLWASVGFASRPVAGRRDALLVGALLGAASLVKLSGLFLFAIPVLAVMLLPASSERWRHLALLRVALIVALLSLACLAPFHYGAAERHKLGAEEARIAVAQRHAIAAGDWLLRYLPGPLLVAPLLALAMRGLRRAAPDSSHRNVPARQADDRAGSGYGIARLPTRVNEQPFEAHRTASARLLAVAGRIAEEGTDGAAPATARLTAFLLLAGLAVIASFVLIGTTLYSRYLLPAWPPLLLAAALGITTLWSSGRASRGVALLALLAATGWSLAWIGWFATAPLTAPLAHQDRAQYLETWSAGQNLDAMLADVRAAAAAYGGLTLVNHNQPRLVHLATLLYLADTPTIRLTEVDLSAPDAPARLANLARNEALLLVVDQQEVEGFALPERFPRLHLLRRYPHPDGAMAFLLFEQQP